MITAVVVLLIMAAVAGLLLVISDRRDKINEANSEAESLAEINRRIEPLNRERRELEDELSRIEKSYADGDGCATFALIMRGLSSEIYTVVFPLMKEFGYTAGIAVSDAGEIGADGMLSAAQLGVLSDAGWEICPAWDGTGDASEWYAALKKSLDGMGVGTVQSAVIFTGAVFDGKSAASLAAAGVTRVVIPETVTVADGAGDGLKTERSCEWDRDGGNLVIRAAIAECGDVVFTADTSDMNTALFRSMLDMLKTYEGAIDVMTLGKAGTFRTDAEAERKKLEAEYAGRVSEIKARITAIKREINDIYACAAG